MYQRHLFFNLPRRFDESDAIAVVFFDTGRNGEDVGIEDDVFGREANFFETLRSTVSAWPCSSNAITTTAAP
jgi:hypothetical protein